MESTRFFVANLPASTTEPELRRLFADYGEVAKVELKAKESVVDEHVKIIAFVTLRINSSDVSYCVNDLNWASIQGAQIKVSVAKESFLDRLKREREEAEAAASGTTTAGYAADGAAGAGAGAEAEAEEHQSELLAQNLANTRKTFSLDVDLNDDDIAPGLLITKKRAASSMHNGKIVIQNFDVEPIHVIETKKAAKQLDAKAVTADQKRKESLNRKKNQYKQNKSAIQFALSGLDEAPSKKIKFSDAEEEDDEPVESSATAANKSKTNIFGSDNEAEDEDAPQLDLKPEYFGKKGEKLLQLQSKQSLDPRFKIDAKFVEDDDEDEDEEQQQHEGAAGEPLASQSNVETGENERDWQMGILEQVVGSKVDTGNATQKAARNKKMLRYDPSKDDHQKFLRAPQQKDTPDEPNTLKSKKKKKALDNEETEEAATDAAGPEVSKDVFYVVTDTLTQSLKTRGDGFSLLNMFGTEQLEDREDQLKKLSKEKILINNKLDRGALNPFSYDSSSESDSEMPLASATDVVKAAETKNGKKPKVKIVMETFFIPKNDPRLKEGAKFFKYAKKDAPEENYEEVRNRLKLLIKTKITKSKKNLLVGGRAKNKRF